MKIVHNSQFNEEQIAKIENKYKAKYVCDSCLKTVNGNWGENGVSIFYQKEKHPKFGNNYLGLYYRSTMDLIRNQLMICDADKIEEQTISGIVADNGDVIYSAYRHDFVTSPDKSVMIDGGRDYLMCSKVPDNRIINIKVVNGEMKLGGPSDD